MLYQSTHDAVQSCAEHVRIVEALERGDVAAAERLMEDHIGQVQAALRLSAPNDPLADLREALAPVGESAPPATGTRKPRKPPSPDRETYLGALL